MKLGVSGILVINGPSILLGKRSANDSSLPGLYCTPGGGIESGEGINEALMREFKEEVGLTISIPIWPGKWERTVERINPATGDHTVIIFKEVNHFNPYGSEDVKAEVYALDGFDEIGWFTPEQIETMIADKQITDLTSKALTLFFEDMGIWIPNF